MTPKQASLGLQDEKEADELDALFNDWKAQLKRAGWAKVRKGEMEFGWLKVLGAKAKLWGSGPLGAFDKQLTEEAKKELKRQRLKANINKINEEMLTELFRRLDPYVQKVLDDGDFKQSMKRILEKHNVGSAVEAEG